MKQKRVFVTCGLPGSGKSSYVCNQIVKHGGIWISRDNIRFSLLKEDDDYFEKEIEVFEEFIRQIQEAIDSDSFEDVYIDATHLNKGSRDKLLSRLDMSNVEFKAWLVFNVPPSICKARNAKREGRAYVPEGTIDRMSAGFKWPSIREWHFNERWIIDYEGRRERIDLCNI